MSHRLRHHTSACAIAIAAAIVLPAAAAAQTSGAGAAPDSGGGGAVYVPPPPPAKRAKIVNGQAIPPIGAPAPVVNAIAAANAITSKPYVWGGGHKPYTTSATASQVPALDRGYDCSGAVSMALHGGSLLKSPLDSSSFETWGLAGKGQWITVYTNPGHAYVVIAGLRFDTSAGDRATARERASGSGPRWRKYSRKPAGFAARHPNGF